MKRPNIEPSGWYFEFANEFYPDIDDTAMVLLALKGARASRPGEQEASTRRAVDWLLSMQSSDGGWAAFDVDNNWHPLSEVPFADHNAMLDPTCPDITGRVLEALCAQGVDPKSPAIRRGVEYLVRTQEPDGSWYGRWGVDYIYGTFLALRGLSAAGESDREAHILRAGEWLRSIQNADGGWGESCASYDNETFMPRRKHALADRLGDPGPHGRRRQRQPECHQGDRVPAGNAAQRRNLGRRTDHGDGISEGLLPRITISTGTPSRCWPWRLSSNSVASITRRGHEISTFPDGRHGPVHLPEQAASTAGVAEGPVVDNRCVESVPDHSPRTGGKLAGEPHPMIGKRFPLVLMLEPLHACNLTCTGCGRIREYESTITRAAHAGAVPGGGG